MSPRATLSQFLLIMHYIGTSVGFLVFPFLSTSHLTASGRGTIIVLEARSVVCKCDNQSNESSHQSINATPTRETSTFFVSIAESTHGRHCGHRDICSTNNFEHLVNINTALELFLLLKLRFRAQQQQQQQKHTHANPYNYL